MPLSRISWLVTVVVCLIAALLLLINGYSGYSGVLLAVGAALARGGEEPSRRRAAPADTRVAPA